MRWVSFIPSPSRRVALRAAQYDHLPVLLTGKTGAGKSRIAEWIHLNSPRSTKPWIKIDPKKELASQILAAETGTVLFEDFHLWGQPYQDLLLQVVRARSLHVNGVRRLVRARVIVTLEKGFEEASPLWDQFQSLHVHIPALVERMDEFEDIVTSIFREATGASGKQHVKGIDRLAWGKLRAHSWPGNIRELREVLRTSVASAQGDWLTADDLPDFHLHLGLRTEMRQGVDRVSPTETVSSAQNSAQTQEP